MTFLTRVGLALSRIGIGLLIFFSHKYESIPINLHVFCKGAKVILARKLVLEIFLSSSNLNISTFTIIPLPVRPRRRRIHTTKRKQSIYLGNFG